MKKKILTIILSLVACMCLAFGIAGCKENSSGWDETKYTGFDVPEAVVLNKGAFYEIPKPITIDVYGNNLAITFQVKDSKGAIVNEIPQGFFAHDENGYTIQFSTKLPNGSFLRKESKVYVLSYSKDETFYTYSAGSSLFKLSQFLPVSGIPAGYTPEYIVTQRGNVVDGLVFNGQFPVGKNVETGVYDIRVNLVGSDGKPFTLRDLSVDVGDANAPVWRNSEMRASDVQVGGYYGIMDNTVEVVNATSGAVPGKTDGLFYKIDPTNEQIVKQGTDVNIRILPSHSKAYYQQFAGQGYKIKFSFAMDIPEGKEWVDTWYFDKDTEQKTKLSFVAYTFPKLNGDSPERVDVTLDTWYDVVISLDEFLPTFDKFNNWAPGGDPGKTSFLDLYRGLAYGEKELPENDGDEVPPFGTEKNDIRFYFTPVTITK